MSGPACSIAWVADIRNDSCTGRIVLAEAGHYSRMPPVWLDTELALPETAARIGDYGKALQQSHGAIEMIELPGALVCGQGAVITCNNELVHDSVREFLAHGQVPDGFARNGMTFQPLHPVTREVSGPCLLVKRPWFSNFGHWIVDCATVLALAASLCRFWGLTLVVGEVGDVPLRNVMLETIERIIPGATILFHPDDETWRFRRLHYVTPLHVPPLFKLPRGLSSLRHAILSDDGAIEPAERLFVMRGSRRHFRALVNSDAVVDLFVRHGFRPLLTERLMLCEAARYFAGAKVVAGVKGAALTNTLFCQAGATVLALSPADFPDPFFWDLVSQRGIGYAEVFGKMVTEREQGLNDFVIDLERIDRAIDHLRL